MQEQTNTQFGSYPKIEKELSPYNSFKELNPYSNLSMTNLKSLYKKKDLLREVKNLLRTVVLLLSSYETEAEFPNQFQSNGIPSLQLSIDKLLHLMHTHPDLREVISPIINKLQVLKVEYNQKLAKEVASEAEKVEKAFNEELQENRKASKMAGGCATLPPMLDGELFGPLEEEGEEDKEDKENDKAIESPTGSFPYSIDNNLDDYGLNGEDFLPRQGGGGPGSFFGDSEETPESAPEIMQAGNNYPLTGGMGVSQNITSTPTPSPDGSSKNSEEEEDNKNTFGI